MRKVTIWTDGSCLRNPGGPGGWAAILDFGYHKEELYGPCLETTNNRMEMTAALEALCSLSEPHQVDLYTDSQYLIGGFGKGWVKKWCRNNWTTGKDGKNPVKNADLWRALAIQEKRHSITWHWVRGHDKNVNNERCDFLAGQAARRIVLESEAA